MVQRRIVDLPFATLPLAGTELVLVFQGGQAKQATGDDFALLSAGVTSLATGTGLTGGPITTTGTISLADTAVTPGAYGSTTSIPVFTVDQQGRITAAAGSGSIHATTSDALHTARTIAGVSFDGTANIALSLDNLSDVILDTPALDQLIKYNGTAWVNASPSSSSAGAATVFYNATPVLIPTGASNAIIVLTLARSPVTTAEQTVSGTAVSNTVAFLATKTAALNRTLIDAGAWTFSFYAGVDNAGGTTTITRNAYISSTSANTVTTTGAGTTRTATASGGTNFSLANIDPSAVNTDASYLETPQGIYQISARTSDTVVTIIVPAGYVNEAAVAFHRWKKIFGATTPDINSVTPIYDEISVNTTQSSFAIAATSSLGFISFVNSTATRTVTTAYNGTEHNTRIITPLAVMHNEITGLQGGVANEYYHLTSSEYTGVGTGVFVRATSVADAAITGKLLTGYTSGAGTVAATDTILQAIQKLNGNIAAIAVAWTIKTTNYTAVAGDSIMADTTAGAFTLSLPAAPAANAIVRIADYAGKFATNNLIVGRNTKNIMGLAEDMTISTNNVSIMLTYIDVTVGWKIT